MKIEIDRPLFRFQLAALFTDKTSLLQVAVLQLLMSGFVFGKKGAAAGLVPDAGLWANYGLFFCAGVAVMAAGISAGFTLVKPRTYGMLELLLASPLSVRKLAATSFLSCLAFSLVNVPLHLAVVRLRFGIIPSGAGFLPALAAALAFTALLLVLAVVYSLRRRDAEQLQVVLVAVGILGAVTVMFTKLSMVIPGWLPPSLALLFLAAAAAVWSALPRLVDKEMVVLA